MQRHGFLMANRRQFLRNACGTLAGLGVADVLRLRAQAAEVRYRMGQVIGATDDQGGAVTAAPYRRQNVLARVYRHLGIDPALMTFPEYTGRPGSVIDERESGVDLR